MKACIFHSDACSLPAATWALAFTTFGAFVAAITAAVFAAGVYDIEVRPRLGQDVCSDKTHVTPDRIVIVPENHDEKHEIPPSFDELRYWKNRYEFTNLGRLPLVGVTLSGTVVFTKDHTVYTLDVDLGNIPVHKSIHLETYFSKKFGQPTITWDKASARQSDGSVIAFHPVPTPAKGRTEVAYGLEVEDPDGEVAETRAKMEEMRTEMEQMRRTMDEMAVRMRPPGTPEV